VVAQCTNSSAYGSVTAPVTGTATFSTCSFQQEYSTINSVLANTVYSCNISVGGYITIRQGSSNGPVVAHGPAPLTWASSTAGTYYAHWNTNPSCGTATNCVTTTITFVGPLPADPPTPTQAGGTPTCTGGTQLSVAGSPAANETWYWQTSASGTSTANSSNPNTVFTNGTYYLRTYNSVNNIWSAGASSVTVTNFPTETTPSAPTAAVNPACISTTVNAATPPSGTIYYWQTSAGGTSNTNDAATPLTVTNSGTVYLSAYNTSTQCWSNTSSLAVTIDTYIPQAPISTSNPLYLCNGATTGVVNATQAATSGTQSIVLASNYVLLPGTTDNIAGTLNIPVGATVTSSTLTFYNANTYGFTWGQDIDIEMTGSATLPNQPLSTGFGSLTNATLNFTPTVTAGGAFTLDLYHNYSFGGNLEFDSVKLVVAYTVPASTISWYSASTGGTALATNAATFETVGSSIITNPAPAGTYHVYAAAVTGACESPRLDIVVNVNPVSVTLNPVHVSCNGLDNGSFTLGTVACGTAPFMYSVDGSGFGAIPTNLTPGNHTIIVQDASMASSAPIVITINEPTAPQNLNAYNVTFFQGMVTWTPQGNETSWVVEYGPAGFTPGTGTIINATNDSIQIAGLTEQTDYDFYVQAGCVTTSDWAGPFTFTTYTPFIAWDNQCGPGFTPIHTTGTALNLADDAVTTITLTNPVTFQGETSNTIDISNNGWISWGNFPNVVTLNVWQTDLDDEFGNVYWQEMNIGGDDYVIVEWHDRPRYSSVAGQLVTFEVALNQTTGEVFYLYDDKVFGGSQAAYDYAGNFTTISAEGSMEYIEVSYNSQTYLQNNSCVRFYNSLCPNVQNMVTLTYADDAQLNWDAGLYGETQWTVVYGLDGFDPSVPGQAIDTFVVNTSEVNFGGTLTQLTCYDAYIYSECQADTLTSEGFLVNFCTKPNCSDVTALAGQSDSDSLELTWNWTESSFVYPVTGFNIQYGMTGFQLGSGTIVNASGINFSDTIVDATLMGSGVYQVYVQAECAGTNDTSNWVGPISVVMPATNDIVCAQEALQLNTNYTFNTAGAGVSLNETNIAPPATGAQTTTGWANSTLNGTLWYTFVAPASGQVRINSTVNGYNSQAAVYSALNCGDFNTFTLIAANDNAIGGTSLAPNFTVCGLTPGSTYYLMYDKFDATTGNFGVIITDIVLNAGMNNALASICYGDTVNLYNTINNYSIGGSWSAPVAAVNASISDSMFYSTGLAYTTFDFEYRVVDGCAFDTVVSQIKIYGPSNAGIDGTISACRNEPISLYSGLNGNADLNGSWYDPSNVLLPNDNITTANFPGQYNYDYISGNGVCPDDTANVVVTVTNCNFLTLEEAVFADVNVHPNPTTGIVYVTSSFENGAFNLVVTDVNGRIIQVENNTINAENNTVNLTGVERGTYFVKLSKDSTEKVFRIVVQ
jgi:hypothetical protein